MGGDWDDFALQNEGGLARAARVLETNLFDHVAGDDTRQALTGILTDVLSVGRTFRMEYRCDAPGIMRDLRMTVTPLRDQRLLLTHDLLDARSLPPTGPVPRYVAGAAACKCSFCNAVREGAKWIDPFDSLTPHPAEVDYAVCPTCRSSIEDERTRIRKAGRVA